MSKSVHSCPAVVWSRSNFSNSGAAGAAQIGRAIAECSQTWQPHIPKVWQRQSALEEDLFKTVADLLVALIADVQKRIDDTCKLVGNLWLHLVFLATCQARARLGRLRLSRALGRLVAHEHLRSVLGC